MPSLRPLASTTAPPAVPTAPVLEARDAPSASVATTAAVAVPQPPVAVRRDQAAPQQAVAA